MIHPGAGELRVRAELQQKLEVRTSAGGTDVTWQKLRDVWVKITGLSPSLKVEAMAREPQITHEIIMRNEGDAIDATRRLVVDGTREFMIAGLPEDVDERGRFIRLLAVEGVPT